MRSAAQITLTIIGVDFALPTYLIPELALSHWVYLDHASPTSILKMADQFASAVPSAGAPPPPPDARAHNDGARALACLHLDCNVIDPCHVINTLTSAHDSARPDQPDGGGNQPKQGGNQHNELIRATHPWSSELIRGHQKSKVIRDGRLHVRFPPCAIIRSSVVISGRQRRSSEVISGHQRSSEVIRGHPRSSGRAP